MKLSYTEALLLLEAHQKIGSLRLRTQDDGMLRIKITHNLKVLSQVAVQATAERNQVIMEVSGGTGTVLKNDPKIKEVAQRVEDMMAKEIEVKLWGIDYASLDTETNGIEPLTLRELEKVLTNMPAPTGEPEL